MYRYLLARHAVPLLVGIVVLLSGCTQATTHQEARQLAEQRFDHQKAKIKYLLALDRFENGQITKAKEMIKGAIALHAEDPQYYSLLVKIYIEQGELAHARQLLDGMVAEGTPDPEHSYLAGVVAERYDRLEQARRHYREAHELDPRSTAYLMAYGEVLVSLDRPAEATYLIAENLHHTDDHARLQLLNGEALQMLGRHDEAAAAFKQAIIEFPQDHALLESYAMALFRAERFSDAILPLRRLHSEAKLQMPQHALKALARACVETGDYRAALTYLWDLAHRDPKDVQTWLLLARCDLVLGNLPDATLSAERAVALEPNDPEVQTMLGFVLFNREDWAGARRALAAAFQADSNDVLALCLLGQLLEATGSPRRAAEYYKRALIVDPTDPLVRQLYERLRETTAKKT